MGLSDYILIFVTLFITFYISTKCYKLYDDKIESKTKKYITLLNILFFAILGFANFIYNMSIFRTLFSLLFWFFLNLIVYKENSKICFYKTVLTYSLYLFTEVVFSLIIFSLNINNINEYFAKTWIITIISIVVILSTYLIIKLAMKLLKNRKKPLTKVDEKTMNICSIFAVVFLILLNYKTIISFNIKNSVVNIILSIILFIISIYIFTQSKKINESHLKNEVFLKFLKTYEKQADIDSEFKHEIFNYLLIMKTIKNKKETNKIIDELFLKYNSQKISKFKNISKLPSGIKGIIYYKVFELENAKSKVELNIANNINNFFKAKEIHEYKNIAEILTILLDNTIDAIKNINKKDVTIDLYFVDKTFVIEISNNINKKVNLNKIENKGFSTKKNHSGIGLYLARNIVNSNKNFDLYFKIENQRFYSIFTIKK